MLERTQVGVVLEDFIVLCLFLVMDILDLPGFGYVVHCDEG